VEISSAEIAGLAATASSPALPWQVPSRAAAAPEALHPALWCAHQIGQQRSATMASGFAALDAVLPGGGWPARALTELLLPHAGIGEIRLLAPALAAVQAAQRGVMLFDPPALPFGWALNACGLDVQQLYLVRSRDGLRGNARSLLPAADVLWALEQTLKSGHVGAVLAWLPARLPADALRRLQLAAQGHDGPAFLLRDESQRNKPSPAPLRLLLHAAGPDSLRLHLLKRRGPPLAQALLLALPAVLPQRQGSTLPEVVAPEPSTPPGEPHELPRQRHF
jgi:protein ImuA